MSDYNEDRAYELGDPNRTRYLQEDEEDDQGREVYEFLHSPEAEEGFRKAMRNPAEVMYPCGTTASEGSPLRDCPVHGRTCFERRKVYFDMPRRTPVTADWLVEQEERRKAALRDTRWSQVKNAFAVLSLWVVLLGFSLALLSGMGYALLLLYHMVHG
jgi:hypothetical protein